MGANEDQAPIVHTRRNHRRKEDLHHNRRQKELEEILPTLDDTLMLRRDTTPDIVPETKARFNKNSKKKRNIPQVMRYMNFTGEDEDRTHPYQ